MHLTRESKYSNSRIDQLMLQIAMRKRINFFIMDESQEIENLKDTISNLEAKLQEKQEKIESLESDLSDIKYIVKNY